MHLCRGAEGHIPNILKAALPAVCYQYLMRFSCYSFFCRGRDGLGPESALLQIYFQTGKDVLNPVPSSRTTYWPSCVKPGRSPGSDRTWSLPQGLLRQEQFRKAPGTWVCSLLP